MKLISRLVVGIVGGILIGLYAPEFITRILITLQAIFGQLIFFSIPLLIVFYISSGVVNLGAKAGALVPITVGIAYTSTILSGLLAFFMISALSPVVANVAGEVEAGVRLQPYFTLAVAPVFGVMSALALAFILGIGAATTGSKTMRTLLEEGKNIIELLIAKVIIPIIPIFIAGIFAGMAAEGTVFHTLRTFGLVLLLAVVTQWIWILILYIFAGTVAGRSPFTPIKTMLPAYLTAIGTMSSAATLPVTLKQAKQLNIEDEIADFVVPLCATIHLSGSTIALTFCAVAVMIISGGLAMPGLGEMLPFIFMLGIVMVAAPGVPGGAIMAAYGLLGTMLGFGEAALGLMVALYMAQDSFGTATNVIGDGALAILVNKIAGTKK